MKTIKCESQEHVQMTFTGRELLTAPEGVYRLVDSSLISPWYYIVVGNWAETADNRAVLIYNQADRSLGLKSWGGGMDSAAFIKIIEAKVIFDIKV